MSKEKTVLAGMAGITFCLVILQLFQPLAENSGSKAFPAALSCAVGFVLLAVVQPRKVRDLGKKTLLKGLLLAAEMTGCFFCLDLGSGETSAVQTIAFTSFHLLLVPLFLYIAKKKVDFWDLLKSEIVVISLFLIAGDNLDFSAQPYRLAALCFADICLALYIVSASILSEEEDAVQLTMAELIFSSVLCFFGFFAECALGAAAFSLPQEPGFYMRVCLYGLIASAVFGVMRLRAFQSVSATSVSLIFSSGIFYAVIFSSLPAIADGKKYVLPTRYQLTGGVFFLIAMLVLNRKFMSEHGCAELVRSMDSREKAVGKSSLCRKIIFMTLAFIMVTQLIFIILDIFSIGAVHDSVVEESQHLGAETALISEEALADELEEELLEKTKYKADYADRQLESYAIAANMAAEVASDIFSNPDSYPSAEVERPDSANVGKWVMHRNIAEPGISYESLKEESMMLGNLEEIFSIFVQELPDISTIYIGTADGLLISYDTNSASPSEGGEAYYEYRSTIWYQYGTSEKALSEGFRFTTAYEDAFGRGITITCAAPVLDSSGEVRACVAVDILLDDIYTSMVMEDITAPTLAILIDEDGSVLAKNADTYFTEDSDDDSTKEYLKADWKNLFKNDSGLVSIGADENAAYAAYSKMDLTDWVMCVISPMSIVLEPTSKIREKIEANTEAVTAKIVSFIVSDIYNCLVISLTVLLAVIFVVGRLSGQITGPLKQLEADVRAISDGDLDFRTSVTTNDEIGDLAAAFNGMADSLQKHMADLRAATAAKERIRAELSVAASIQASMLPKSDSAFPDRNEFDISASMRPARVVGGDFYDFFLIDADHLALVIGDVSGKGVPASLFMVVAKTMIRNCARTGETPAEILSGVNAKLCEGNDMGMFVTIWLVIVEISTGKCIEANAGHEHPVIRRKNGGYELVKYKHSPAVAVLEDIHFSNREYVLEPGDRLFVYTDGVPEAADSANEMFGTDRMIASLDALGDCRLSELIAGLQKEIDSFVNGAEQFDDITMLGFDYYGKHD